MSTVLIASTAVVPTTAHPPNSTDHDVPEETFHKLWSGDQDAATAGANLSEGEAFKQLANGTDVPLDSPPRAVEQWNRNDHHDFPPTDSSVSIYPSAADTTSDRFVKEAYTEVFAVQPSTRARLSSSGETLYVAPNGMLRGTVDYRVAVPSATDSRTRRVSWSLVSHQVRNTTLLVDGDEETTAEGSHTPALSYSLDGDAGESHRLTLRANITVRLRKDVQICTTRHENGDCLAWRSFVSHPLENVTVTDSIEITTYDLAVSGYITQYPNGDLGLVVYKNQPWLGYSLPNGDVRGVWRFYSARDTAWDRLIYSTEDGQRPVHSPLHPLQVNAYPIETGPTPSPRRNVAIIDVYGASTEPPTLPSTVNLDVLTEPYTASYGIATRARTDEYPTTIRAWGLVRGVQAERPVDEFAQLQMYESNLSIEVVNQTEATVTVQVQLRNANSSAPINTAQRSGYVVVNGQRVNTTGDGTAEITIERTPGGVSARYVPGYWWRNLPGYTGDTDSVVLQESVPQLVATLFRIGVPVSIFLLAVFFIDRITNWGVWPPWRGL